MPPPDSVSVTGIRRPLGYQQITTLTSAVGLTLPTVPAHSCLTMGYAVIQAESGDIRWRDDGTNPTGSVGMLIPEGGELNYCGDFSALKLINSSGSTSIANVAYYA